MAERRDRPRTTPPSLEDDDRFFAFPAQIQEAAAVGEGLEIQTDHLGVGIVQKKFQDVAFIHVDLVPDGADLAHPHRGVAHDINQEDSREHSALHDEGDGSRDEFLLLLRPRIHEGKDVTVDAIDQTHAVGPPNPDAGANGDIPQDILQAFSFGAGFRKTSRFDDDAADTLFHAGLHCRRDQRSRNEDNGKVYRARDVNDGRVAGQALDLCIFRIDRKDPAPIAKEDVFQDGIPAFEGIRRCADHCDPIWIEEEIHLRPFSIS